MHECERVHAREHARGLGIGVGKNRYLRPWAVRRVFVLLYSTLLYSTFNSTLPLLGSALLYSNIL